MRSNRFKPMLSAHIEDLSVEIKYPVYATPKLDGIRCLLDSYIDDGKLKIAGFSRSLKLIPNLFIQQKLNQLNYFGLDGELIIPKAINFGQTTSSIMTRLGSPDFKFFIFDLFNMPNVGYLDRITQLEKLNLNNDFCYTLIPIEIKSKKELIAYENKLLSEGFLGIPVEGVMFRSQNSPYKYGRSTIKEGYLVALKRFTDGEAEIVGWIEQTKNNNPKELDNLGYTKRSSAKAGKELTGVLGSLKVRDLKNNFEFELGSGFTPLQRHDFYKNRETLLGQIVKYKHQTHGAKDSARIPIFLGFRDKRDI